LIHRWKDIAIKEKLIFLLLFAILLPTGFLLVGQYFALSALRDKSRSAFENNLRQNFVEIDNKTEARLLEKAEQILKDFPESSLESWNSEQLEENLNLIVEKNEGVKSAFVFQNKNNVFSLADYSKLTGFREAKSVKNPGEAINSFGDDDFVIPLISSVQSSNRQRLVNSYFIGQRKCEKCTVSGQQQLEILYLYRVFSSETDFNQLKTIGVRLDKNYLVGNFLAPIIKETAESSAVKTQAQVIFGVFNEQQQLLFTNAEKAENLENFEVKSSFGRSFPLWTLAGSFRDSKIEDISNLYFSRGLAVTILVFGLLFLGVILILRVTAREVSLAQSKSAFVSNVSHELKTPLALIRLFAETLQSGRVKNPEKVQEYYRIINTESVRLTHLINNILDFSAIEAGRKDYNFEKCDLSETVADVVNSYSFSLENAGFEVKTNFAENLPLISIDCDAISQAVINLLNNAAKYSLDEKFVEVNIERRKENIAIEITDHGIGIAPNEQAKIFEDFYRVGGSNDVHNVKGSGLGLALVKHIAEAHGGRISVNSVLHRGSTFTILLPIENAEKKKF
jgi:signal transduction histidine kinase